MIHVAIMNKKVGAIERILNGKKRIESRWYVNKTAPWDKLKIGEVIYFKYSGAPVIAKAEVEEIRQFEIKNLNDVKKIVDDYPGIDLIDTDYRTWAKGKRYCVLIWLKNPKKIEPFGIDKRGFGSAAAWLAVGNIDKVRT